MTNNIINGIVSINLSASEIEIKVFDSSKNIIQLLVKAKTFENKQPSCLKNSKESDPIKTLSYRDIEHIVRIMVDAKTKISDAGLTNTIFYVNPDITDFNNIEELITIIQHATGWIPAQTI